MKNIKQIKLINNALLHEKEKYLHELIRINRNIEKKLANIKKILAYQNEYHANNNLSISKSIPSLYKNLNSFSKKIQGVIQMEEGEVNKLKKTKSVTEEKIGEIEHKIKIMTHFNDRCILEKNTLAEKVEQSYIDEMSSTKFIRSNNE